MNFPIERLENCNELYFHGLGDYLKELIKPKKLDIGKTERLYYYWINSERPISISDLKKIGLFSLLIKKVTKISAYSDSRLIKLPKKIDKELAYLCGYHLGDGCINKSKRCFRIHYMDSKEQLIRISKIYQKIFGISLKIKKDKRKKAFNATIVSKALVYLFHYCLDLSIGKKGKLKFLPWINNNLKKDFIIGFLDAEFGVSRKKYQFSGSSIDKEFLILIQKELQNYGLNLKLYGPYSYCGHHLNPIWFLKASKLSTMYWLEENGFIRHPNHLKTLKRHINNYAPVV